MKKYILVSILVASTFFALAQNTLKVIIRNDKSKEVLDGATAILLSTKQAFTSDSPGLIHIPNLSDGKTAIRFTYIGYLPQTKTVTLPLKNPEEILEIGLEPQAGELAEVVVQSTRTNQNLKDIPTRIEALPTEELDEKSAMKPGDIKMLLNESTGILVQQTSAVSGTANIRIQGLDSRYTQLLKDGMPLYQGFSGGLSLLQISPLDLKQVEFIKRLCLNSLWRRRHCRFG